MSGGVFHRVEAVNPRWEGQLDQVVALQCMMARESGGDRNRRV